MQMHIASCEDDGNGLFWWIKVGTNPWRRLGANKTSSTVEKPRNELIFIMKLNQTLILLYCDTLEWIMRLLASVQAKPASCDFMNEGNEVTH